jgi:hypothetical protein
VEELELTVSNTEAAGEISARTEDSGPFPIREPLMGVDPEDEALIVWIAETNSVTL